MFRGDFGKRGGTAHTHGVLQLSGQLVDVGLDALGTAAENGDYEGSAVGMRRRRSTALNKFFKINLP